MPSASDAWIAIVARRLGPLKDDVVFVGGSVLGLLIDDPGGVSVRPTDDVDVIVSVASRPAYSILSARLIDLGFQPDTSEGAPMCRWIVESVIVDVMPAAGEILGFTNRWYEDAIARAMTHEIAPGLPVRVVTAPYFLAMKLEAFADRGGGDFAASHDLEDVVAISDGVASIIGDMRASDEALQQYLAEQLSALLADDRFLAALPARRFGGPIPGLARARPPS